MEQINVGRRMVEATLEEQAWLDRIAEPVQQPLFKFLEGLPTLRSFLDGTWLGHPVHAAVTDLPVGAWSSGFIMDTLGLLGVRGLSKASDAVQTIGLLGALSAAVFGLADWSYTGGRARRIGFIHGVMNVGIAGIYGVSLLARSKGNRGTGIALSSLGYGLLLISSWLGGELAYKFGIGVNRTAFQEGPKEWKAVARDTEVREGEPRRVEVDGMPIMLVRYQGQLHAIGDTCTHMGCSLSQGKLEGNQIICGCHGSYFRITDGQVVHGPAVTSEPYFEVRVMDGQVEVRQPAHLYGAGSRG